jgi:hypothetical protein
MPPMHSELNVLSAFYPSAIAACHLQNFTPCHVVGSSLHSFYTLESAHICEKPLQSQILQSADAS